MSAQEMIRQELRAPWRTKKEIEQLSQELYEAVAHELAEQQRIWARTFGEVVTNEAIRKIVFAAADRIDPEVN